jgi:hypothetical protein
MTLNERTETMTKHLLLTLACAVALLPGMGFTAGPNASRTPTIHCHHVCFIGPPIPIPPAA